MLKFEVLCKCNVQSAQQDVLKLYIKKTLLIVHQCFL